MIGIKMKKLLGVMVFGVVLTACGGGSSDDSQPPANGGSNESGGNNSTNNAVIGGIYTGTTNQGQSILGLVDKNSNFWFLYSPPYKQGITGLISGSLGISGNAVNASNGKDFYFGGGDTYNTTLSGTAVTKKSLDGSITYSPSNQVIFNTVYDADASEEKANLSAITGKYAGDSALVQGTENASLTISSAGVVSGEGRSGCAFSGKVTPEKNTAYYNIDLTFGYSPCYLAGQTVSGVVYYDPADKVLYAVAESKSRQDAVLFLGSKR